jgi:hypothetical protein
VALDPTAREANIKDSIKKFFVDNIYTAEGVELLFDKSLTTPKVQGREVDRWVAVAVGGIEPDTLSTCSVTIFCCSKMDSEGFKLSQLRDKVMGYLVDSAQPDGAKRIPFYRSHATEAWTSLGNMLVIVDSESPAFEADDGTKFKTIEIRLRWGATT